MSETPKRGWFRFSTRDLLWLTAVIALILGWWVEHREDYKWRQRAGALEQLIREQNLEVLWGKASVTLKYPDGGTTFIRIPSTYMPSDFISDDPAPEIVMRGLPGSLPNSSAPAPKSPNP